MLKILTLNKIAKCGMNQLDDEKYVYGENIGNPDAIILRSFAMHDMELPKSLKAVARAGAGVNNIPIDKCSGNGIVVFNTPGANANAVKELVIASLFLSSRKIVNGINWAVTLKNEGENVPKLVEKGKSAFAGPEISGKKLGVIGLGAIGVMVCNAADALGMEVIGLDPYISVDAAWGLSSSIKKATSLKEIYETCDYITLHVPLNSETRDMINSTAFESMKPGVRILNFSRGELVNTACMLKAIEEDKVSCYVTDFPDADLIGNEAVIAIPHLGASTPESEDNCAIMAVNELVEFLEKGNIINSVNFPNCYMDWESSVRVCVTHRNIPNMLGQISSMLATKNINIQNMLNKSRGDYAYTILDIDEVINDGVIQSINDIDGVLNVRVISL